MSALIAAVMSLSVLPTPANTIVAGLKPASLAAAISFSLTQSAPNPYDDIIFSILGLWLALTA